MHIRLLERNDQLLVEQIMAGHPLQFPPFVIERYPDRWHSFLTVQNNKQCGYYVALANSGDVVGHAGYLMNEELALYEIVGVAVSQKNQRQGIGRALIDNICNKICELGMNQVILYTLGHAGTEDTLSFYRGNGFEMMNFENDFFRADYHRVTFVKAL
jgi:N-acetylglutamate synthase-like GNAT family acetyltransferase